MVGGQRIVEEEWWSTAGKGGKHDERGNLQEFRYSSVAMMGSGELRREKSQI